MADDDRYADARRMEKAVGGPVCTIVGTNRFVSTEAAIAHCRGDWATAKAKIALGEIVIGEPVGEPGQALVMLPGGQFGILLAPLARDRD